MRLFFIIFIWLSFAFTLLMNSFGQSPGILSNFSVSEISDIYSFYIPIMPVKLTFVIWSVIYTLIIAFNLVLSLKLLNKDKKELWKYYILSGLIILSNLINAAWIYFWVKNKMFLSSILILCFLLVLIITFYVTKKEGDVWLQIPISVYVAWLSLANVLNISIFLVKTFKGEDKNSMFHQFVLKYIHIGINGLSLGILILSAILLITAFVFACLMLRFYKSYSYCLIYIWIYFGIYLRSNKIELRILEYYALALFVALLGFGTLYLFTSVFIKQKKNT